MSDGLGGTKAPAPWAATPGARAADAAIARRPPRTTRRARRARRTARPVSLTGGWGPWRASCHGIAQPPGHAHDPGCSGYHGAGRARRAGRSVDPRVPRSMALVGTPAGSALEDPDAVHEEQADAPGDAPGLARRGPGRHPGR